MPHARLAFPALAAARALAAALAFVAAAPLAAQSVPSAPKSGYGTDDLQVVSLSQFEFDPFNSTTLFQGVCCFGPAYRRPTAGAAGFVLPINASIVPNGARLEEVTCYVRDLDDTDNGQISCSLCRSWTGADGSSPDSDCPLEASTPAAGTPGDTALTLTPNLTIEYSADVDGDQEPDSVSYLVLVQFGGNGIPNYGTLMRLYGGRVLFRRQVSPAPSSATFNDVPTSHPFFPFVEALASSGITAGCGTGIYCPDSPLTRGQMAVFLAKALGLHWPATAP